MQKNEMEWINWSKIEVKRWKKTKNAESLTKSERLLRADGRDYFLGMKLVRFWEKNFFLYSEGDRP